MKKIQLALLIVLILFSKNIQSQNDGAVVAAGHY